MSPLPRTELPLLVLAGIQVGIGIPFIAFALLGGEWPPGLTSLLFLVVGLALVALGVRNVGRIRRIGPTDRRGRR